MKQTIKKYAFLAALFVTANIGASAQTQKIVLGSVDGGTLAFYTDEACNTPISDLTAVTGGNTVYILATPAAAKCHGVVDENNKVNFIQIEKTASSGNALSRTRGVELGECIDVMLQAYPSQGCQVIYKFEMPDNANVTVTAAFANPQLTASSWTYGDVAITPSMTAYTNTGENAIAYSYKKKDAGDDTYTNTVPTAAGEYTVRGTIDNTNHFTADFTIGKKPLEIIADAKTKVYGTDDPTLTYTSTGLVGSDAITGSLTRSAGENVGKYRITQGTLTAGNNYTISYTAAVLTITEATLTGVTATGYEGTFDGQSHTITVSAPIGSFVKYGSEAGIYYTNNAPKYTYAGTYTVFYQVSKRNYTSVTGSATVIINASTVVDEKHSETIDGETFYEPTEDVQSAINTTMGTNIAFSGEASGCVSVTDDGSLQFSQGKNVHMALKGLKIGNIIKCVYEGKIFVDSSKLRKNTAASRGTRNADDLELVSGEEYQVLADGDIILTIGSQESPVTLKSISISTNNTNNTTGIDSLNSNSKDDGKVYDLNGRYLQGKPTKKGVYIQNGKKVVVR